jgi:cell wall-associated NlpC family hydrolase
MVTGWQTISGSQYYFSSTGAMLTGIQTIGTHKYYFGTDGKLTTSLTIIVGSKQYTINSKGVVTSEKSLKISEKTTGDKIVNFALQYVGNPYVYGGTSLTKGADCSGFVQTVFANFNIKLPRVADEQMKGQAAVVVDISSIQPGDLIFYGTGNYASHVAIYIGNGKIVHASNSQPYPAGGIKISAYNYTTPIRAVRYWS